MDWYLERASEPIPDDLVPPARGDWGRLGREAFIANNTISARSLASEGDLRLRGVGVEMNSADLNAVGAIATAWQKAVAATGAALEHVKTLRGSLPIDVLQRTALVLNASPQPGSVVLHLQPKADPLPETEPEGDIPMVERARPLADRAAGQLISLLRHAANVDAADTDALSADLRNLGPRVGGALSALAQVLERANITLDASWAEPEAPTVRASVTPSGAKWISQFVAGRGLDAEEQQVQGVLRTVSDRERWLVEVGDEDVRMDASELDPSVAARWHVGASVLLTVRVAQIERPDGTTRKSMKILRVSANGGSEPIA
ncbi:MAG TPA: hypothetical protein VI452_06525 [Marmoricola sp.]